MQDIINEIKDWIVEGKDIALATVIDTWGSSPRPVGAKMGVNSSGGIAGSVSAGCVEGAVVEVCQAVISTGTAQLLHYGITDDDAFDVGLMCGGKIEIFVRKLNNEIFSYWEETLDKDKPSALVTIIGGAKEIIGKEGFFSEEGERLAGNLPENFLTLAQNLAQESIKRGKPQRIKLDVHFEKHKVYRAEDEIELFVDVTMPKHQLFIIGGVHISIPLVTMAKAVGYTTVVIDPRKAFCNAERFPHADRLLPMYAKQAFEVIPLTLFSAVAVLTHDPKIDDEALNCALNSPAFYIGGLGSKRTQSLRRERLVRAGFTQAQLQRIKGPIGLDLLARTPQEIALSIMAEIVLVRNQL